MSVAEQADQWGDYKEAEVALLNLGMFQEPSPARRRMLGCMACIMSRKEQLDEAPEVYGYEIVECMGKTNIPYRVLTALAKAKIMFAQFENPDRRQRDGPLRKYYVRTAEEAGEEFWENMPPPPHCPLQSGPEHPASDS